MFRYCLPLMILACWSYPVAGQQQTTPSALATLNIKFTKSTFQDFQQFEFKAFSEKVSCRIVEPKFALPGKPWIWRARFFGHQPALDVQLLERGFHVAYCDVANLYGAPKAVERWNKFYQLTQQLGLHPKPVLEGMSRGGLIIFNWAKMNPEKVSAIYGDNPVCDIRSWPREKSPADWRRCQAAWGFEGNGENFESNPIDDLKNLASAKVPVYLVLGTEDKVVPPSRNANVLAQRYNQLGGPVKTWRKAGAGHHPHGLNPPDELVQFLIQSTLPKPDKELQLRQNELKTAKRILFLGDSITFAGGFVVDFETWCKEHQLIRHTPINAGLPSENVSGLSEDGHAGGRFPRPDLHERLERVLDQIQPDLVFACYGMNCGIYQPLDELRLKKFQDGIVKLKAAVEARQAKIIFITPMPFDSKTPHPYQAVLQHYSYWLLSKRTQNWDVVDFNFELTKRIAQKRQIDPEFTFQKDRVHPNSEGHREAAKILTSYYTTSPIEKLDSAEFRSKRPDLMKESNRLRNEWLTRTGHLRPGTPGYRKPAKQP